MRDGRCTCIDGRRHCTARRRHGVCERQRIRINPVTDSWITTKVKAELATTDGVKSTDISVKTVDGVVTLTGVLGTPLAVKKAVAAAESIKGVKKVDHDALKSR